MQMSERIKTSCLLLSLTKPGDEFEAEAEAEFICERFEFGIDVMLDRCQVWINGNPSFTDIPAKEMIKLENMARADAALRMGVE
jgi:hypothetical protein